MPFVQRRYARQTAILDYRRVAPVTAHATRPHARHLSATLVNRTGFNIECDVVYRITCLYHIDLTVQNIPDTFNTRQYITQIQNNVEKLDFYKQLGI